MSKSIKCRCGQESTKGICKNCSRIRMVVLIKNGFSMYKENNNNPVRYNFVKTNRQPNERIIVDMVRRLMDQNISEIAIHSIQFYDNFSKELIEEFK